MLLEESSFKDFIYKELDEADGSLSFNVKNYLADLLQLYLSSDQLFEKDENGKSCESALADLYKKGQKSNPQEKIYIFKRMGDFSLYLCGFFRAAIKRKIVHISYYENMGQSAYSFVSASYGPRPNVFKELSSEFKSLSEILFAIQKRTEKINSQRRRLKLLINKK